MSLASKEETSMEKSLAGDTILPAGDTMFKEEFKEERNVLCDTLQSSHGHNIF